MGPAKLREGRGEVRKRIGLEGEGGEERTRLMGRWEREEVERGQQMLFAYS